MGGYGEMIVNSSPNKFIYNGEIPNGERHGHGIMQIMSGPQKGERYMANFDDGLEVIKSRKPLETEEEKRSKRRGVKRYSRR
jgi:hypothetical protein